MESYVGPYRILRLINRGGQGSVFLGYDERLRRQVAIKIHTLPAQREGRRQLLREARMIAGLESPKIVQVHDVIESPGYLAMVLEYVPGCSLEDLLRIKLPTVPSALVVGIDMAGALAMARRKQVVHGDLKAANVLISDLGRAKLTDFGIARGANASQISAAEAGSLSALSPERCRGEVPDHRADAFALGVLLYRMLTGEHPFADGGRINLALLARGECTPLGERIGGAVDAGSELPSTVDQLLSPFPEERLTDIYHVRRVLRAQLREYPIAARYTLAEEAQSVFRESVAGRPQTEVPSELGHAGRSRLRPKEGVLALLRYWLRSWNWWQRLGVAALLLMLVVVPVVVINATERVSVQVQPVEISMSHGVSLPSAFSGDWVLGELQRALAERLGRVQFAGQVGGEPVRRVLSAHSVKEYPVSVDYEVTILLQCAGDSCMVDMQVSDGRENSGAQGWLSLQQGSEHWSRVLNDIVARLFP